MNIIDTIKKIQGLSSSDNINETAAAADQLIMQYRLLESELSGPDLIPEDDDSSFYSTARITRWKQSLAVILARHYGCAIWNDTMLSPSGRKVSHYRLVGIKSDIQITRFMFGWLISEIEKLRLSHARGYGHVAGQSYCEGVVMGIKMQLEKSVAFLYKEAALNGRSISLSRLNSRLDNSNKTMRTLHTNLRNTSKQYTHRRINQSFYSKGVYDGKKIPLNTSA